MSIDPISEQLITLNEAAGFCPRRYEGRKPHITTIRRWADCGYRGIQLETLQTPGGLCTSKEALCRFFNRLTATRRSVQRTGRPRRDEKRLASVERKLSDRFGV